jgi:hypothetical protein
MARQRTKVVTKAAPALAGLAPSGPSEPQQREDISSIAALAYQLWQARGCPDGSPDTDWFQAEQELHSEPVRSKPLLTRRPLLTRHVGA